MFASLEFGLLSQIALVGHPDGELPSQIGFDLRVLRIRGQVRPFVGILLQIKQFLGRPMLVAANLVGGVRVVLRCGFPGLENFGMRTGVFERDFRREVEDVFEPPAAYGADAEIIRTLVDAAGGVQPEHVLFVFGGFSEQDR